MTKYVVNGISSINDHILNYPKTGYNLNICLLLIKLLEDGYAYSLSEIAITSCIDQSNIYKFLKNKFSFSIDNLLALCITYNLDANIILGLTRPNKTFTETAIKKLTTKKKYYEK